MHIGLAIMVLAVILFFGGCENGPPPQYLRVCTETKTEMVAMPAAGSVGGVNIGGGLRMVPQSRCVDWEWQPNPEYARWMSDREER